jgi:DNA-binding transcriptional LysR family regulator
VVLVPTGHPLEQVTTIDTPTLARQDLLLLGPGHCFRDQVLRFCPECNRLSVSSDNMQRTLEGSSLETIRLMVATGMGITVSALHLGQRLRAGRRPAQRPAVRGAGADPGRGAGLAQKLPAPPGHRAAVRGYSGLSAGRGGADADVKTSCVKSGRRASALTALQSHTGPDTPPAFSAVVHTPLVRPDA